MGRDETRKWDIGKKPHKWLVWRQGEEEEGGRTHFHKTMSQIRNHILGLTVLDRPMKRWTVEIARRPAVVDPTPGPVDADGTRRSGVQLNSTVRENDQRNSCLFEFWSVVASC